jgi:hypothetical protein
VGQWVGNIVVLRVVLNIGIAVPCVVHLKYG